MKVEFGSEIVHSSKHSSKSVPLTTAGGKQIVIAIKDCFSYGVQKSKYDGDTHQIPLVLGKQQETLDKLHDIRQQCLDHLKLSTGENIMRCLYEDGAQPTMYAKVAPKVVIRRESNREERITPKSCMNERGKYHVAMVVESIFRSNTVIAIQIKVRELMILEEKEEEEKEDEWAEMF